MWRLAPLLLFLLAGCQRPVAAVLTYGPAPAVAAGEEAGSVDMAPAISVIQRRLRPSGLPCRVSLDDSQNVRIEVFDDDQETLDRIDRIVTALGTFEFRIAANSHDHIDLIKRAQETDEQVVRDDQGNLVAWWVPIDGGAANKMLDSPDIATREVKRDGVSEVELLVVNDLYDVDGNLLVKAAPGTDQAGRPNVTFVFSNKGGQMMAGLTTDNLPDQASEHYRKLAIILNDRVFSAPRIQATIRERGEISGDFTKQEVEDLVNVLNSGSLPTPLVRVNVEHVGDR